MSLLSQNDFGDAVKIIEPYFIKRAETGNIPGTAYGIVANGRLIGTHTIGYRELNQKAVTNPDTVFRIASMTKSFCAAAVLQLRDAGKLQLDDLAVAHVPELKCLNYPTADTLPITIRHLLTMTAGLPQDDPWADRQLYRDDDGMNAFYQQGATFSSPPATRFEYSNYGYMLLGRIVSNVSGQSALDYITDHILKPLGMHDTVWNAADVPAERLAHGYFWLDGAWQNEEMLPSGGDNALFAGLFTTVADLGRWINLFLSAWPPRDEPDGGVLKRGSLREMQQPWSHATSYVRPQEIGDLSRLSTNAYGYGLFIQNDGQFPIVGHGGGLPGFGSYMCWSPEHNIGIIALGNQRYSGFSQVCTSALTYLIEKLKVPAYKLTPSAELLHAQDGINRLLHGWDDALADSLFADNFFLDLDRAHWKKGLDELRETHGSFRPGEEIVPENRLRGIWRVRGERGWCKMWLSMTPTVPPLVQKLDIKSILPLSTAMETMIPRLIKLVAQPVLASLDDLRSDDSDQANLWDKIRLARLICGICVMGDIVESDGRNRALITFKGEKADASVDIQLDQSGKLAKVRFWNNL
ncbi:MAG: CubicO group peptidase (beta-lactamase class C family) [Cellvibrionaceae bacterium]|jgi:CubicO group peptidase (beta-lactamase class C family)